MRTNYHNRIRAATWVSAIFHLALVALAWWLSPAFTVGPSRQSVEPITITFAPTPPTDEALPLNRQLVDVAMPATERVRPTDLIATENSNASDTVATPGENLGPQVDKIEMVDSLGGKAGAAPTPEAPPTPETPTPTEESTPAPEETTPPAESPPAQEPTAKADPAPSPTAAPAPTTMAMAKAEPPPAAQTPAATPQAQEAPQGNNRLADTQTQGRRSGGVQHLGVKGFEALQDEIAPYLKEVQRKVEQNWRSAMLTKYNGAKATDATLDCEIGPDGKIVSLKFYGVPEDRGYAALCKEAIEKAGPFGAFPFVVPEIYRNRNLEIRWSFKFL